jgi:uncharacterized protein (TIGR03435 family)
MGTLASGRWIDPLLDHLWQSTAFAGAVWLLVLALRKNAARIRYRLWMVASLKFLVPFSLLVAVGARLQWMTHLDRARSVVAATVEGMAEPVLQPWPGEIDTGLVTADQTGLNWRHLLPPMLLGVWVGGVLLLLCQWTWRWLCLRAVVRYGEPITLPNRTRVLLIGENVEPGVFGIVRPVLVLPRGIVERLSTEQLDAIVTHELCHIRRRDNLTAALHMAVKGLFWFHPLVWWLEARLVAERERACDEAVLETTRRPLAYAEGILNVCKFYVEVPLSCVSGITGSGLKERIALILSGHSIQKLYLRQRALLALSCVLAVGLPLMAGLMHTAQGQTQPAAAGEKDDVTGTWQGIVHTPDGHDFRLVLKIAGEGQGKLSGTLYSIDQNGAPMAGSSVSYERGVLRFVNQFPGLTFQGKLSADGKSINGILTQNGSYPLILERANQDTAWTVPAVASRMPAMAADANPGLEVATIKPSSPDAPRTILRFRGSAMEIERMSLNDLIEYAWDVQEGQIENRQSWMGAEKWDIEAKPDTPGTPNPNQLREMVRKLLAERFAFKFHQEKRNMSAYVLKVGRDGPKMAKSADQMGTARYSVGPGGLIRMTDAKMGDLAEILQRTTLSRPVLDRTGLDGRWDFVLKWLPDESQFGGQLKPPPPDDPASSLPSLFTAMQEQLGLKLESQKTDVSVLVIDQVDHPSSN